MDPHIAGRQMRAVVNLVSSEDDDNDDDVESLSGDNAILASLAARADGPAHMRPGRPLENVRGRVEELLSSASPEPQPLPAAPRLDLQPPRFERIAPQGLYEPPRAILDFDSDDSDIDLDMDSEDDIEAVLENMNRPHNPAPRQPQPQTYPQQPISRTVPYGEQNKIDHQLQEQLLAQFNQEGIRQVVPQADHPVQNAVSYPAQLGWNANGMRVPCHWQPNPPVTVENLDQILVTVSTVFPGICFEYVGGLYPKIGNSADTIIAHILDMIEKGTAWPTAKDKQKSQKRKRDLDEDEQAALRYGAVDRVIAGNGREGLTALIRDIMREEFPETPMTFVNATLGQSGYRLFSAYRVLEEAQRTFDSAAPVYNKIKPRKFADFTDTKVDALLSSFGLPQDRVEVLEELKAARRVRRKAEAKRAAERLAEVAEEENTRQAERDGTTGECSCCCGDYPLNRMVHCNGHVEHLFCRQCALKNAETLVGNSKYELTCMSMDGCTAGFSVDQRLQFLTPTTIVALERNEQEAVLRMAGIENLASCPFCPYAAEYPPIKDNKEFHCKMPDCEKVSCRLCNLESHIPKSCEEFAKENGLSIRREIEEAMTAALIRKCNKCDTPFIKEEGCNKMTCSRPGCHNIQCYVCSKSCGYDHFDDQSRGGKAGNCPLFESVSARHEMEVNAAEQAALAEVRAKHPEYTAEDLKIKMSDNVAKDDERRKANDPRAIHIAHAGGRMLGGDIRPPAGAYFAARARLPGLFEVGDLPQAAGGLQAIIRGGIAPGNDRQPFPNDDHLQAQQRQAPQLAGAVIGDLRRMEAMLQVQEAQVDRELQERQERLLATAENRLGAALYAVRAPRNMPPRREGPAPVNQRLVAIPRAPQLRKPARIPIRLMSPNQQLRNQAAERQQRVRARVQDVRARLIGSQDPDERQVGNAEMRIGSQPNLGREAFLLEPVQPNVQPKPSPAQIHREAQERNRQHLLDGGRAQRPPQSAAQIRPPRRAPDVIEID